MKTLLLVLGLCATAWPLAALGGGLSAVEPGLQRAGLILPDLAGELRHLDELRGQVVVVNFWASWCLPCVQEMPSLQRLAEAMRGKPFALIGVNVAEGELRVKAAVRRLGIGFPVLLDRDSGAFERWGAGVLPTTYVLDPEGVVRYVGRGPMEWDAPHIIQTLADLTRAQGD
jgi:thiol-disulfide isomerase/thioredoxin